MRSLRFPAIFALPLSFGLVTQRTQGTAENAVKEYFSFKIAISNPLKLTTARLRSQPELFAIFERSPYSPLTNSDANDKNGYNG